MKRVYIQPITEIVRLNVSDDFMDEVPINQGSKGAHASDAWAKRHNFFDDDDDFPSAGTGSVPVSKNPWND